MTKTRLKTLASLIGLSGFVLGVALQVNDFREFHDYSKKRDRLPIPVLKAIEEQSGEVQIGLSRFPLQVGENELIHNNEFRRRYGFLYKTYPNIMNDTETIRIYNRPIKKGNDFLKHELYLTLPFMLPAMLGMDYFRENFRKKKSG